MCLIPTKKEEKKKKKKKYFTLKPTFEWYMVGCKPKDMCWKEIGLRAQNLLNNLACLRGPT